MEEEEDMSPPFWLQQNGGNNHRPLRRSYSLFLSSGTLVIILLVIVLTFICIVVPTLHSFTSNILKPHSVKKSWDSLNLVLVLFAIFCGFLSRNNNEDQTFSDTTNIQEYATIRKPDIEIDEIQTSRSWYCNNEYSDRTVYNRLRSFRSYPDLRQESSLFAGDERWRFYDDTHVNGFRELHSDSEKEEAKESMKNIEVDTLNFVDQRTKNDNASSEKKNKKTNVTKELFTSLKKKKKKKKKQSILNNSEPPPPPPPPPPSSIFHNMLSSEKRKRKDEKRKDIFELLDENGIVSEGNESPLIPIPPPPPPPPPFKMPAWKFRVQGDFVRIDSISSSGSGGSPDLDEIVEESPRDDDDDEPAILLVYPNPTPDVDTKADNFIQNFRAGLRRTR